MIKRLRVIILAAAMLCTACIAGCSGSGETSSQKESNTASSQQGSGEAESSAAEDSGQDSSSESTLSEEEIRNYCDTWVIETNDYILTMQLADNGIAVLNAGESSQMGDWVIEDGKIVVTVNDEKTILEYRDNKMWYADNSNIAFIRQSVYYEAGNKPRYSFYDKTYVGVWALEASASSSDIKGAFRTLETLVLHAGGKATTSATGFSRKASWSSEGEKVSIFLSGEERIFDYTGGALVSEDKTVVLRKHS